MKKMISLSCTLTTYGVVEGINSCIVQQEVTMDDLFVKN